MSVGRQPDGSPEWYLFPEPTPGVSNTTTGYPGISAEPELSLSGGFYDDAVALSMAPVQAGLEIYYTLDGSEPDESSNEYIGPILIQTTSVVRARSFTSEFLPSDIITATYLIGEDFQLPVVSLSTDPPNLWDYDTGIYVLGPNAEPDFPYHNANSGYPRIHFRVSILP